MVFDFTFTKIELTKNQLFPFVINEMISKGWVNLSEGKTDVDQYAMFSTGESGNEKIGVQLRTFYSSKSAYDFNITTYGYWGARPFHSFTKNPNQNSVGSILPNNEWVDIRLFSNNVQPNEKTILHYHINKDRTILVFESSDLETTVSATFFVLGKPHTIADVDEYCASAVIASHGTKSCVSGWVNNNSKVKGFDSTFRALYLPKGKSTELATPYILANDYDGDKYIVENIFRLSMYNVNITSDLRKNTFTDSEGRVYKLCVNAFTSSANIPEFSTFMIRVE